MTESIFQNINAKRPKKEKKKIQSADFSAVLTAIFVYLHLYDTKNWKFIQIMRFL
jgi:hypothetical protein